MKRDQSLDHLRAALDFEQAQQGMNMEPMGPARSGALSVLIVAAVTAWAVSVYAAVAYITATAEEPAAICDTDEDCMRHCPPPADDPDCDGGPQT